MEALNKLSKPNKKAVYKDECQIQGNAAVSFILNHHED